MTRDSEQATITAALASGEDRGILLIGNTANNRYHYEPGLMNGAGANLADNNDLLDTAVRLVLNPTNLEEEHKYWLGISYSTGSQTVVADQNDALSLRTESRSKKKFFAATFAPDRKFTKTRQGFDATYLYERRRSKANICGVISNLRARRRCKACTCSPVIF